MQPSIDPETGRDLLAGLSGEYVVELCDDAWLYCTELPGDTVSAAARTPDDVLHIFVDLAKPDGYAHARHMMHKWAGIPYSAMEPRPAKMARFV